MKSVKGLTLAIALFAMPSAKAEFPGIKKIATTAVTTTVFAALFRLLTKRADTPALSTHLPEQLAQTASTVDFIDNTLIGITAESSKVKVKDGEVVVGEKREASGILGTTHSLIKPITLATAATLMLKAFWDNPKDTGNKVGAAYNSLLSIVCPAKA